MPTTFGYRDTVIDGIGRQTTDVAGPPAQPANVSLGYQEYPVLFQPSVAAHTPRMNTIMVPLAIRSHVGTDLVPILGPIQTLVFLTLLAVRLGVTFSSFPRTLQVLGPVKPQVVTIAESLALGGQVALGFAAIPSPLARHAQIVDRAVPSVSGHPTSRICVAARVRSASPARGILSALRRFRTRLGPPETPPCR